MTNIVPFTIDVTRDVTKASPYDITGYLAAVTITIVLITNSLNYQLQISHPPYYVLEEKANSLVFEKDPFSSICKFHRFGSLFEFLNKIVNICFHSVTLQGSSWFAVVVFGLSRSILCSSQ